MIYRNKIFILTITDKDDGYDLVSLAFKSIEELNEAKELIDSFTHDFYSTDSIGNYYEDLLNFLDDKGLNENKIYQEYFLI